MMDIRTRLITAHELERMPQSDAHVELVKGEIIKMSPAGHKHGEIAGTIFALIHAFVRQHKLGKVYAAETGFILSRNPDTVRAPDAAFVSSNRLAQGREEGFFDGAPDLAVEVISPEDTVQQIEEKISEYLQAGTKLVWIVHPSTHTVATYRSLDKVRVLTIKDTLDGDDVLPEFSAGVKEVFD